MTGYNMKLKHEKTAVQPAVILSHISKQYTIQHEKPTLVEKFVQGKTETFFALNDISLTVKQGERIGFIGPNGSGKTTLLKIIAGITKPTTGIRITKGKIISLIDLEAGFHPELTGYQNIFVNGLLLGLSRQSIQKNIQSIIRFADIRQFIDTPLYTYSQGMKLRLGFSIAIHAEPDILILDEGITVGDEEFQNKVEKTLFQLFQQKKTVIVATHLKELIELLCTRTITIRNGEITAISNIRKNKPL
jgi:ABC-type polysaccharide/polyol phosphate transport system ATPase subunit